jgi:hypothetical protein
LAQPVQPLSRRPLALFGGAWAVLALTAAGGHLTGADDGPGTLYAFSAVAAVTFTLVGVIVVPRRPHNAVGWLFAAIGLSGAAVVASDAVAAYRVGAWVNQWTPAIAYGLLPLTLLLFPDGRLPSPRWRPVAWTVALGLALAVGGVAVGAWDVPWLLSDPEGPRTDRAIAAMRVVRVGVVLFALGTLAAVASILGRWRRAEGQTRQQLKWLALGAAVIPGYIPLAILGVPDSFEVVAATALPAGAAVAILRYRLYDIDRLISRTLSYTLLTGLLTAVYLGGVVLLRPLVGLPAGDSPLAVAASTLAVAALFGPARRRVQAIVDRRFYRARYDAARAVDAFAQRVRDDVDLEHLVADLRVAVTTTVQPSAVSVWLRPRRPHSRL